MYRGTTPVLLLNVHGDFDWSEVTDLQITLRNNIRAISYTKGNVVWDGEKSRLLIQMSQNDTLALSGDIEVQLRYQILNGNAFASNIARMKLERIISSNVVGDDVVNVRMRGIEADVDVQPNEEDVEIDIEHGEAVYGEPRINDIAVNGEKLPIEEGVVHISIPTNLDDLQGTKELKETIERLSTSLGTTKEELGNVSTRVTNVEKGLEQKASKDELKSLSGKVDNKAEQSALDYVKNDVDKKATKEELETATNALSNSISSLGNRVTKNEENIAKKADSSDVYTKTQSDQRFLREHQSIKTINGKSMLGEGNVTIEGMTDAERAKLDEIDDKANANDLNELAKNVTKKANKSDIATINGQSITNGGNVEVAGMTAAEKQQLNDNTQKVATLERNIGRLENNMSEETEEQEISHTNKAGYWKKNGSYVPSSSTFETYVYALQDGMSYRLSGAWQNGNYLYAYYAFCDENGNPISLGKNLNDFIPDTEGATKESWYDEPLDVPSGAATLEVTIRSLSSYRNAFVLKASNKSLIDIKGLKDSIDDINEVIPTMQSSLNATNLKVSNLENKLSYSELIEPSSVENKYVSRTGVLTGSTTYKTAVFDVSDKRGKVNCKTNRNRSESATFCLYGLLKNNGTMIFEPTIGYTSGDIFYLELDGDCDKLYIACDATKGTEDVEVILTTDALAEINSSIEKINDRIDHIVTTTENVNILCCGNSLTIDSMSYVPFLFKHLLPNVNLKLGILYRGSSDLGTLANLLDGSSQNSYTYYLYDNETERWTTQKEIFPADVDELLSSVKWDIITYQQVTSRAALTYATLFEPQIIRIQKSIFSKINYGVKFGWILTHSANVSSYESQGFRGVTNEELILQYEKVSENAKKVMDNTATDILFPYGTAIQSLRSIPAMQTYGTPADSIDPALKGDNTHLQEGIGALCANYTNALTIIKALGYDCKSIIGDQTLPSEGIIEYLIGHNIPIPNWGDSTSVGITETGEQGGGVIGMTPEYVYLAQLAAMFAMKKPYEITDLNKFT